MILVTGGTGLVGAHLLYHLSLENDTLRAIYRSEEKLNEVQKVFSFYTDDSASLFSKIEWIQADITEVPSLLPAFKNVTKVYHCAALISFNTKRYREMRKVNIGGTANIVNLAIDAKVDKLCFVGSIATIGNSLAKTLITEENEWNDQDDHSEYGITKYGAEMEVWRASQEGVQVVIVNPGVILGSGFLCSGSGKMFSQVQNGLNFYTEGITGFVGVKDVVKSMIQLMKSSVHDQQFIVVSENKSFKEVLESIANALGKNPPKFNVKPWQMAVLWRLNWLWSSITRTSPLITKQSAKAAHGVSRYSSEKIQKTLVFEFQKIKDVILEVSKNM